MEGLSGLLEGLGNTDDIPALITAFAAILTQIIEMIKDLFASLSGETPAAPEEEGA